jgi:hypothetical protein
MEITAQVKVINELTDEIDDMYNRGVSKFDIKKHIQSKTLKLDLPVLEISSIGKKLMTYVDMKK